MPSASGFTALVAGISVAPPQPGELTAEEEAYFARRRRERELYVMQSLPATEVLERLAEKAHAGSHTYLRFGKPQTAGLAPDERERRIRVAERRLELGRQRDDLWFERPAGCWCMGLGGSGKRWVRGTWDDDYLGAWVFDRYCHCPDGQAAAEQHRRQIDEAKAVVKDRLLRVADIPHRYAEHSFASYPVSNETADAVRSLHRLAGTAHWALLWGPVGSGKTGLAVSLLREAVDRGLCTLPRFVSLPEWLAAVRRSYGEQGPDKLTEDRLMDPLEAAQLLVIDDLGVDRTTPNTQSLLYRLINARYNAGRQTVLTTNLEPDELREHIGARVFDRILECCGEYVICVDGPNLRVAA